MDKILHSLGREDLQQMFAYEMNDEMERKIQENLSKWQAIENPLAPLSPKKLDVIYQMREQLNAKYFTPKEKTAEIESQQINNYKDFMTKFISTEREIDDELQSEYVDHQNYLSKQSIDCNTLQKSVNTIASDLQHLGDDYQQVASKINSLHALSEQLMKQQLSLKEKKEEINERLHYFTNFNVLSHNVGTQSFNYNSSEFIHILDEINTGMSYMESHMEFKEAFTYKLRYEQLLSTCLANVVRYVNSIILEATQQVVQNSEVKSTISVGNSGEPTVETAFSYYYGKFQNAASKTSLIIRYVEENSELHDSYEHSLMDFYKSYFSQRAPIMQAAVSKALLDLRDKYKAMDHAILFRSAALFIVKVCQDEAACYSYFFQLSSKQFRDYLNTICQNLYDILRPCLIAINHIEVLTELCTILKEMINDSVQNNPSLHEFVNIISQLIQDVEERLVFRTNIFFQYDIQAYEPSPGDLAYPEKLEEMEDIAEELIERRADSRTSSISIESQEVANINATVVGQFRSFTGNSPADLHGMWYPTVKRILVCLSRLYICLDRGTFQGVAQEGLLICVKTLDKAADRISERKSSLDGKLFQIKHLLIIREQIAPFQVDFTVKELGLDFSNMRSAAVGLVQKRDKIFALNSNNAILEFLLEGTPRVKEYLVDSRKEIDKQLKFACETFIANTTTALIGTLQEFLQKGEQQVKLQSSNKSAFVKDLAAIVANVQRNIKSKIPEIQKSMRLYLANRETEFILFRPIKNNIINTFIQLDQFLTVAQFTSDDILLIAMPTIEQLNVLISSVSLTALDQDLNRSAMSRQSANAK